MLEDEHLLRTVIEEEGMPFDLSIEEMNRVYESITQDLYEEVAKELIANTQCDEVYNFEKNEAFS